MPRSTNREPYNQSYTQTHSASTTATTAAAADGKEWCGQQLLLLVVLAGSQLIDLTNLIHRRTNHTLFLPSISFLRTCLHRSESIAVAELFQPQQHFGSTFPCNESLSVHCCTLQITTPITYSRHTSFSNHVDSWKKHVSINNIAIIQPGESYRHDNDFERSILSGAKQQQPQQH